ncbi:hypothetical protein [Breoghania sp.]|uniref:hypothetical protein n=1 Tax=Breoghania sp. TaxID=2065378 RepID=UPI00262C90A1|nr:hypothetical protein [Breoghania sp.]MDJ0931819.1 hypothetical protein [Breoghania sp.]
MNGSNPEASAQPELTSTVQAEPEIEPEAEPEPEPEHVTVQVAETVPDDIQNRASQADAVLQALKDMARTVPEPEAEPEETHEDLSVSDKIADEISSAIHISALEAALRKPSEPRVVEIEDRQEDEDELPTRAEFDLRRTSPPARPGSLAAVLLALSAKRAPSQRVENAAPRNATLEITGARVRIDAQPRPDFVTAPGERAVQPGATLAPRDTRTAPTPGFSRPDSAAEASAPVVLPKCRPALERFLSAGPEGRAEVIVSAQVQVLAQAAASRVRMRSKIDTELVQCLERTSAAKDMETLRRLLSLTFELPAHVIERMIADPHGEPLIALAMAAGMATSRTVSLMLQVSPAAFSLDRVRELAAMRGHFDIRVARYLVSEWTGLAPKPTRHAPVLDVAMRSRRATIGCAAAESAENTADDDGVLVLRNVV